LSGTESADISFIATKEGWLYLAIVLDLFSRKVIGWSMDRHMTRHLAMNALRMAYWRRKPSSEVIHHSDRGVQYASSDFQALLKSYGMICSMSGKGNCYDNGVPRIIYFEKEYEIVN